MASFPLILSSLTFHSHVNTFKRTIQSCATNAMEPPYQDNAVAKLWCKLYNSFVLKEHTMFEYFKVAKMAMVQVLSLIEDEYTFLTLHS